MLPVIKILDLNLELIGLIDDYESFYFEEKYADIGECTLTISVFSDNFKLIEKNTIIYLDEYKCWYIEEIGIEEDIATIKALSLNFILGHRITIPPKGFTHISYKNSLSGEIIKAFVRETMIESPIVSRNINMKITDRIVGHITSYKTRLRNLFDEVRALANYSGLGFRVGINIKEKYFIFDVFNGRDRTQEIIFSEMFDNIDNISIMDSNITHKNHIYVAGQGQGVEREIIEVDDENYSGWNRREEVKDARNESETENLEIVGEQLLAELSEKTSIEATILSTADINIGEIVLIISKKYGYQFAQRIVQIDTEYTKAQGKVINLTVGSPKPTFTYDNTTEIE